MRPCLHAIELHMIEDYLLWKVAIRQAICQLADFNKQQSNKLADEGELTVFLSIVDCIYVNSRFTNFLAYRAWQQAGLSDAVGNGLIKLQQKLDAYDEPDTDAAIAVDPLWNEIVMLASTVIFLMN